MSDTGTSRLPLLIGIVAVLGGLVYLDRASSPEPPVVDVRRPPPPASQVQGKAAPRHDLGAMAGRAVHPLANLRLIELTETLARPLFEPSRRPQERAVVAPAPAPQATVIAAPAQPEVPRHRLLGVVSGPDGSTAVLSAGDTRPMRVELGDVVDGWEIVRITQTEVTLARGGKQAVLTISRR